MNKKYLLGGFIVLIAAILPFLFSEKNKETEPKKVEIDDAESIKQKLKKEMMSELGKKGAAKSAETRRRNKARKEAEKAKDDGIQA